MQRKLFVIVSVTAVAMLGLASCTPAKATLQSRGDSFIRTNISDISPRTAPDGGKFTVTDIEWIDADTALVTYESGQTRLVGRTDISFDDSDAVIATRIRLDAQGGDSPSSSMTSSTSSTSMQSGMSSSKMSSTNSVSSLSSSRSSLSTFSSSDSSDDDSDSSSSRMGVGQ